MNNIIDLNDIGVNWTTTCTTVTNRGKVKAVMTGEPSSRFWKCYPSISKELNNIGITLKKYSKGQFEVILWLNKHNALLAEKTIQAILTRKHNNGERSPKFGNIRELMDSCMPKANKEFTILADTKDNSLSDEPF